MLISSTNRSRPAARGCVRAWGDGGAAALLTNLRVRVSFSVLIYGNEACPPSDPYLQARESRAAVAEGGVAEHLIYIFFNLYIERAEERLKRKMKDGGGRWEVGRGLWGVQAGGERGAGDK